MINKSGVFWPTPRQELLLRAALLHGPAAKAAWEQWAAEADINNLDAGSFRMLPLLYHNLSAEGLDSPMMNRLRGVYRYQWSKNQVLFWRMAAVLEAMRAAGIRTMLLKGAALATLYYPNAGLRPMDDFDVLVPLKKATQAAEALAQLGWRPILDRPLQAFTPAYLSIRPGHGFRDPAGQECDLHWHVLFQACWAGADDGFWEAAVPVSFQNQATCALNPADQLMHICGHSALWSPVPSFRWMADAMMLLRTASIDWQRFVAQAQTYSLALPALEMLAYLQDLLNAPIPAETLQQLKAKAYSGLERRAYVSWANPPNWRYVLPQLETQYRLYSAAGRGRGAWRQIAGVMGFLQDLWGVEHAWQLPWQAFQKFFEWWTTKRLFLAGPPS